jgi:hypothetical protein
VESSLGRPNQTSRAVLWVARGLYGLAAFFMLFDSAGKFFIAPGVADAFSRLGLPISLAPLLATILFVLTILYLVPRTSILGAVLMTGYLGGACACNLRAGSSAFETLFPIIFGAIVWVPVYLLDPRLRALVPIQKT